MLLKSDAKLLKPSKTLLNVERRLFRGRSLSLGALMMLTGCDAPDDDSSVQRILNAMQTWNDNAQGFIFSPNRSAPTYSEAEITKPFPFNAYYSEGKSPDVKEEGYKLELAGLIEKKDAWTLEQIRALPQESQITRHICVEGWSAIGQWGGVPLRTFLTMVGADLSAKFVNFKCADDYSTSLDMATALHPQTIMALTFGGNVLPRKFGFPFKVRVPTKLGFKNPKHVMAIEVTNTYPGGYWEDQGYNWFSGS